MKTILLADHMASERAFQKEILTKNGFNKFEEAADAKQAVEKFIKSKPDLVIIELDSPELDGNFDGILAIKEIKAIDNDAKIIACTEHGARFITIEAMQLGVVDLHVKPILKLHSDRLSESVKKALL